ncbi:unnamed protein product [Echinostoma caproni]|uniref:Integrase catalytic domain-containing protein n=1 Tax=Echinostoma caproni TaxID=27848 RepID=A0A183A1B0_9TREM|nr:unnamed protein product [Echinostoma caproni]
MLHCVVERWVATYGCPVTVTTDRGSHFEGAFKSLLSLLGCTHAHTTAYHPAANGLVERFHLQLKAALKAHSGSNWHETAPLVLLGIRNTIKADLHTTPAALAFGCSVRLPGELVAPTPMRNFNYADFAQRLSHHMREVHAATTPKQTAIVYVAKELSSCTHVFLRVDSTRAPLQAPYTGPLRVTARKDKTAVIDVNGRRETVSLDRLRPAFLESSDQRDSTDPPSDPTPVPSPPPTGPPQTPSAPTMPPSILFKRDRRGREFRRPVRFDC